MRSVRIDVNSADDDPHTTFSWRYTASSEKFVYMYTVSSEKFNAGYTTSLENFVWHAV